MNLDPTIIGEIFLRCCSIIRPLDIRSEGPLELDQGLIAVKPTIYDKLIYHIYDIFVTDCKIKTNGWTHHTALYGDKETVLKREQLEREKIKPIPRWLKRKEELKLKEDNIDIKKIIEDHYLTNDICRVVIINEDFVEHTIISPFDYFKHNITKIYNNIFVGYAKEDASFTELYFTYDDIVAHFIPVC